jgi:hypothetical protein
MRCDAVRGLLQAVLLPALKKSEGGSGALTCPALRCLGTYALLSEACFRSVSPFVRSCLFPKCQFVSDLVTNRCI